MRPVELELDATKSEARNVPPGNYHVSAKDALGREVCVKVRVKQCQMPVVIVYQTEGTTTEKGFDKFPLS